MGVVVSVNVGLPQDVAWQGRTVRTAVWKTPVTGRIVARRLNFDGDGQGDLQGHGGEQRAIMVYQLESYRYWAKYLGRSDLAAGNFGENLTVEGLADNEVCIGDRFRIGKARCRRSVILSSDGCASNNLAISAEPRHWPAPPGHRSNCLIRFVRVRS